METLLPVTVVIPTWRREEWLRNCLAGIARLTPAPERVLVIGREEDSASREVAAARSRTDWASVDVPGHVDPIRVAVRLVATPYLAVIDDDGEPLAPDWLARLYAAIASSDVACVGSRVEESTHVERKVKRNSGRVTWWGQLIGNVAGRADAFPVEVDALPEGNWLWRTSALQQVVISRIYDDGDASMYGLDLCLQAKQRGGKVLFVSDAPILHHSAPRAASEGRDRDDGIARTRNYARNCTYIALTRFGRRRIGYVVWTFLVGDNKMMGLASLVVALTRGRARPSLVRAGLAGRWDGFLWWIRERAHATEIV